ncbi:purine and uridine phosphorylase, partial [Aureobasidium melanogenum]
MAITRLPLDQWLEHVKAQKHGALPQHTQILKTVIEDSISPEDAAQQLIDDVSSSRDAADTAYRLWNLLFHTSANLPSHITAIVNLTLAIYNVPLSPQTPNTLTYNLWTNWQDVYSYYHTYRTLASPASRNTLTNADRWINFTIFSATLLNRSDNEMFVKEIGIHGFFVLRDALEMTLETYAKKNLMHNSVVTAEQAMETDVVAAAQWVMFAGDKLLRRLQAAQPLDLRRIQGRQDKGDEAHPLFHLKFDRVDTPQSHPHQYTVGWICAIPTESIAASLLLDEEHERPDHVSINDSNDYTLGKMKGHNVVIAVLPDGEYGQTSATSVVKDMLSSFPNIRVGLMVGIGGGAPTAQNDIRLGDIVVSSPRNGTGGVYQYDYGKLIQGQGFQQTGFLNQPSTLVRTAVSGLRMQYKKKGHTIDESIREILHEYPRLADEFSRPREDRDRLYKADFVHPVGHKGDCDDCCRVLPERIVERRARTQKEDNPAIHHGIIASGNWLMKDASVRDTFASEKGIMCFEMEAAGLMNHLPCLVIRGICDYSDSHKNKEWQGYAAMTAAAYAKDLLARMVPSQVQAEQKVAESLNFIEKNTIKIIETTEDTAAGINELKADAKYHHIHGWLSPPDHNINQIAALTKRHDGTGQWFVKGELFTAFKEGKVPFLWLSGIPGCGKTILSSSIIEDLQHNSLVASAVLLYFYFDFSDVRKQTLDNALRSLLWQVTNRGGSSFREVEKLYESCNDGQNQPPTQSLIRALESVLQATGRVIIVLDALDECTTRPDLLQWLAEISAKNSSGTQIIATSRKEYDIEDAFAKWLTNDVMLSIQQLEVDQDIQAYVHARIRSDPDLQRWRSKPLVQKQIEEELMKKAQGMFRWAKCQLDSLTECVYLRKLQEALKTLPTTLDATYARILDDLPPMYLQDTISLLQILTWSERPLLIEEAVDYLAVELDSELGFDEDNRLPVPKEIMRFCSSLVTVARTSEDPRGEFEPRRPDAFDENRVREEIRLAHYSVKEYLTSNRYQSDEFRFYLSQATSPTHIASVSLAYLLQLQTNLSRTAIISGFPLALYSASHWMNFARVANPEDNRLRILIERLLLVPERRAHWLTLFNPDAPWLSDMDPPSPLPQALYYASLGGLECVADRLLRNGADIDDEGGRYDNALQAAAARGFENIVNLLLQNGADVNAYRHQASTLQVASENGHVRVVQSLLEYGADVNAKSGVSSHISALHAACSMGFLEVAQLLLNNGAEVNMQGGCFGSALQVASLKGCDKIVQLLLERGADHNASATDDCGEALVAAFDDGRLGHSNFRQNRENVVLLLLEKCNALRAQDERFAYVLHHAAKAGFESVVRRLLTTDVEIVAGEVGGTDANAQDEVYGRALDAASRGGHDKIVQMLLDKGAYVSIWDTWYRSALMAASEAAGLDDFFFEVEIVGGDLLSCVAIGLCNGSSSKTGWPGLDYGSWVYHGDNGTKSDGIRRDEQYTEGYGAGDIICCGIDFNSNTITFYKNGISLGKALHLKA